MKSQQLLFSLSLALLLSVLPACAHEPTTSDVVTEPEENTAPIVCTNPRPVACTMDFNPVCATRDTGIRCITDPCPSSEEKTYSNACSACSDGKVSSYVPKACAE